VAASALASDVQAREIVITFGGDVSANRSRVAPQSGGTRFGRRLVGWSEWTQNTAKWFNGDINFINLETVIAPGQLRDARKKYTFLSHPNAVRHLVGRGVNLFSLANNHAYDYGARGVKSTLKHMRLERKRAGGRIWYAGIGRNDREAAAVKTFKINGHSVAYAAIGNLTNMNRRHRAGPRKPGSLGIRIPEDWQRILTNLGRTKADLKILSCHLGVERKVRLDRGQKAKYERAIDEAGVDLLIGHHPHVVRPIQKHRGRLIFYSLGNFMMRGARDMTPLPDAQDYGLFGRVYMDFDVRKGRMVARAVEIVPLTQMHAITQPLRGAEGRRRITVLNRLSRKELGDEALVFKARRNGSAVACLPGPKGKRARRICGRR